MKSKILVLLISTLGFSCSNNTSKENEGIGRYQAFVNDNEVGILDTKTGTIYKDWSWNKTMELNLINHTRRYDTIIRIKD